MPGAAGLELTAGSPATDRRDAIGVIIQEYASRGWHRTGTEVDARSARWLAGRVTGFRAGPVVDT